MGWEFDRTNWVVYMENVVIARFDSEDDAANFICTRYAALGRRATESVPWLDGSEQFEF